MHYSIVDENAVNKFTAKVNSEIDYLIDYLKGREGYFKKFPKHRPVIEEKMAFLREKGGTGVFVSKLLPMVRTLISIPAGMVKMNFTKYTVSSACGIFLWNLAFVGAGYFFGDAAINFFT